VSELSPGGRGLREPERGLRFAAEALELFEREGLHLHCQRKVLCRTAFELSLARGDLQAAGRWVQLSYEHSRTCHGEGHHDTRWLRGHLEEPAGHPAYLAHQQKRYAAMALAVLLPCAAAAWLASSSS